jgi:hypothetical protein
MPYTLHCDTYVGMAVVVSFGSGENSTIVAIIDAWADEDGFVSPSENLSLTIHRDSKAAKELSTILCNRAAEYMGAIAR